MILHEALAPIAISFYQSAIKIDIARNQSAIFVLLYCIVLLFAINQIYERHYKITKREHK